MVSQLRVRLPKKCQKCVCGVVCDFSWATLVQLLWDVFTPRSENTSESEVQNVVSQMDGERISGWWFQIFVIFTPT